MRRLMLILFSLILVLSVGALFKNNMNRWQQSQATAQSPLPASDPGVSGGLLLTVFLRHDESKTLGEINAHLKQTGYYAKFPPPGIDVVSWYVVMGIGQVVTLRVPPGRLREVNRILEETAWGGYRTEFYPTYDYKTIAQQERRSP
jgi:hypothetical protein